MSNMESSEATQALGKVLFYDKKLSVNNSVSCATCHKQTNAFSDNQRFSEGFGGRITRRNAPGLFNLFNESSFFWDMRANGLRELALQPVQNHIEMGIENVDDLIQKLSKYDYYPPLFEAAFESPEITEEGLRTAIVRFLGSLKSSDSKFDRVNRNETTYTALEQMGRDLFHSNEAGCLNCHRNEFVSGWNNFSFAANIGLDVEYEDNGLGELNGSNNNGNFKVPQLRNVALTAPYMHDGRFSTLEEVVEHYSSGIQDHPRLHPSLTKNWGCWDCNDTNGPRQRNFTNTEKRALVAFLETLTDYSFVTNSNFSDPFKN